MQDTYYKRWNIENYQSEVGKTKEKGILLKESLG